MSAPILAQATTAMPADVPDQVIKVWTLPRDVETYRALFQQAGMAAHEAGLSPYDAYLVATKVLSSIGIHIPAAMQP